MMTFGKFARFLVFFLTSTLPAPCIAQVAQVEGGTLTGQSAGDVVTYKGVPFAAAPVGRLRWKSPQPVMPWPGIRQANAFAPACMQRGVSMPGEAPPVINEDCLYLNIWAPAHEGPPRAVLVKI